MHCSYELTKKYIVFKKKNFPLTNISGAVDACVLYAYEE